MSTNPVSAVATLIARGPLTIGGTVNLQTGRAVLRGGKLTLAHHQLRSSSTFSRRTCLATLTSSGTYRITGGTGRYLHVRGHGHYRLTAYAIVAKVHGQVRGESRPVRAGVPAHRIRADPAVTDSSLRHSSGLLAPESAGRAGSLFALDHLAQCGDARF
jgi:hypothetical protein